MFENASIKSFETKNVYWWIVLFANDQLIRRKSWTWLVIKSKYDKITYSTIKNIKKHLKLLKHRWFISLTKKNKGKLYATFRIEVKK